MCVHIYLKYTYVLMCIFFHCENVNNDAMYPHSIIVPLPIIRIRNFKKIVSCPAKSSKNFDFKLSKSMNHYVHMSMHLMIFTIT